MANNIYHHEEIYRGKEIMDMLGAVHLTVCGAGAIGSLLVDNLARQGFKSFRVIDFDRVEKHNINNQIYSDEHVGAMKANELSDIIYGVDKYIEVEAITKKLEDDNIKKYISKTGLVVDAFDNIPSRRLVRDYCKKNNIPCVHAGVLIDFAEVMWNDNYQLSDEQANAVDACDYPLARNIVVMVVVLASEIIIDHFVNNKQRNAVVTLKNLNVRYV
jgi:molybdopterin/thiamine biosynthesis adenylyltransferase